MAERNLRKHTRINYIKLNDGETEDLEQDVHLPHLAPAQCQTQNEEKPTREDLESLTDKTRVADTRTELGAVHTDLSLQELKSQRDTLKGSLEKASLMREICELQSAIARVEISNDTAPESSRDKHGGALPKTLPKQSAHHRSDITAEERVTIEELRDMVELQQRVDKQLQQKGQGPKKSKNKDSRDKTGVYSRNRDLSAAKPKDSHVKRNVTFAGKKLTSRGLSSKKHTLEQSSDQDDADSETDINDYSDSVNSSISNSCSSSFSDTEYNHDDLNDLLMYDRHSCNKKSKHDSILRSGISKKNTDMVKTTEIYPQSCLRLNYVTKKVTYNELDMPLFVAGYIEPIKKSLLKVKSKVGSKVMKKEIAKLEHLISLMYLSKSHDWESVRELHASVLHEIELGNKKWGDSFIDVEVRSLPIAKQFKNPSSVTSNKQYFTDTFCRKFNRGECLKNSPHSLTLKSGETIWVKHICASCLQKNKEVRNHPEISDECPVSQNQ